MGRDTINLITRSDQYIYYLLPPLTNLCLCLSLRLSLSFSLSLSLSLALALSRSLSLSLNKHLHNTEHVARRQERFRV
jgi:hypothetical protein